MLSRNTRSGARSGAWFYNGPMLPKLLGLLFAALPLLAQSNPEMARIFEEDQKDRANFANFGATEKRALLKRDTPRRRRVGELLREGALKTGEDYERASFIFQHGDKLSDFVMAHVLAMTASAVEPFRATWISAATFDRLLLRAGKQQVFGTGLDDKHPFAAQFLPDAVREANCVPSLAVRAQQIREMKNMRIVTPGPCNAQPETMMGKWALMLRRADGSFSSAFLEFGGTPDDLTAAFTENGTTSEPDDWKLDARRLTFRVENRIFQVVLNGGELTGTFTSPVGGPGRVVGLASRPR